MRPEEAKEKMEQSIYVWGGICENFWNDVLAILTEYDKQLKDELKKESNEKE